MLRFIDGGLQIIDERNPYDSIFNYGLPSVSYTLQTDDITKGKKPVATPYESRVGEFVYDNGVWKNEETKTQMWAVHDGDGVRFILENHNDNLSEWGLRMPFNFQGKMYGGGFRNQFLFNSPYITQDRKYKSFYLSKVNGNHILVVVLSDADGWKMDYSPILNGAYFWNLKVLANFDKAYGDFERKNRLEVGVYAVKDYFDVLDRLAKLFNAPFMYADFNAGEVGKKLKLTTFGKCDKIVEIVDGKEREVSKKYEISREGEVELVPYYKGVKGGGITVYGYKNLIDLYKKSVNSVDLQVVKDTSDENLCEHQCWAHSILRFLRLYKEDLTEEEVKTAEKKCLTLLGRVTETDPEKAQARLTILDTPFEDYPQYNIFRSRRIQEQFFGTSLFLDAYKYFQDEKYYRYAVGTMDSLLDAYQKRDGRLETSNCEKNEDYTSVCSVMIPLADMYNFLKDKDGERARRYKKSAEMVCEFLYRRGYAFKTEGGSTYEAETRITDGTVACTMLTLLYYCYHIEKNDKYLAFAKELLDLHEAWVMRAPICQMRNSSLRWWETNWEGDADGPALDCGHAWTIWRAESDWLYYKLTGDKAYRDKAINGFNSNFSKINEKGESYAIYNADDINGGGFHDTSDEIEFKIANKFHKNKDSGLSRYVWYRAVDSILTE